MLTDGRLNAWEPLQPLPCPSLLVDIERSPVRLGRARLLAQQLQADYRSIESFKVLG
ncbi:hypothetical protein D3C72_2518780 [compost metagenome]